MIHHFAAWISAPDHGAGGQTAWTINPERVQTLAGYPLTGAPSAVQFLEMLYNAVVRG